MRRSRDRLRADLEHTADSISSAKVGRAIEVAVAIHNHASVWIVPMRAVKSEENLVSVGSGALWGNKFKNVSIAELSTLCGSAVDISRGVQQNTGKRMGALCAELVQNLRRPSSRSGSQFVNCPIAVGTTPVSCSVKVAGAVECGSAVGIAAILRSVSTTGETQDRASLPATFTIGRHFEHRVIGGAEDVSMRIHG